MTWGKIPGLFTGHDPTRGSGQGGFKISRVGSGRVITFQNLMGRVGSGQEVFKISRVGSGRVKRLQNLAGRVGSGQEVFKISRVGSGHDPRKTSHFAGQAIMTREVVWADPRVKPADLAGGSAFLKLTAESHVDAVQTPRGSANKIQTFRLPASLVPMLRSYVITACRTITRQYP